ncbi:hypothetical protein ACQ4PT_042522 [Festuca glaucescens]
MAGVNWQDLAPTEVVQFEEDEILVIGFEKELPIGEGVLTMNFTGTLNDQMRGFYRRDCTYFQHRYLQIYAKFKLTLQVPSELVALSNMPVVKDTLHGPLKTVYYEESPLMSTYLVAIVVGLFDYIESSTLEGTKVRVYIQVGMTSQGKFALDVGVSYLAVESIFPEWNNWTQFLDETTSGLRLDALAESHPIEVEVNHASEIGAIFDSISYDKGASVIRMLQSYLGAERFQKALASYIKKYAYSNAKTEDLWAVLEEETGEPVKDLMTTWTKQQGYPVIYAKLNGQDLELEQAQFLSDGSSGPCMWIVPMTSCCGSYDVNKMFLLKDKTDKIHIKDFAASQIADRDQNFWIKLNIDQTGFYRVKYDDELAAGLENAVKAKKLSLMDMIGIVEDSYALSVACKQTLTSLLRLLNAYRHESDYTVLSHVTSVCLGVDKISADATPDLSRDIKQLLIKLLLLAAKRVGWDPKDGESHLDAMLRLLLLIALVKLGHDETINEGIRRFHIFLEDRTSSLLPPDNRKAAYLAVMRTVSTSSRAGYEALLKIYRETSEAQEKSHILGSLSSCRDKDIVVEALNLMLTDEVNLETVSI